MLVDLEQKAELAKHAKKALMVRASKKRTNDRGIGEKSSFFSEKKRKIPKDISANKLKLPKKGLNAQGFYFSNQILYPQNSAVPFSVYSNYFIYKEINYHIITITNAYM